MTDTIVYTTVSNGGGIDGMDHTDKGGNVTGAYLDKLKATKNPNAPWNTVVPIVVDLEELAKATLRKLDPVARLAVEQHFRPAVVMRGNRPFIVPIT
jgi:hypothetical protein